MAFVGIKSGDRVTYLQYAGMGRNGPEYKRATRRAIGMLCFASHVVVGNGKRGDSGQIVDASNYVSHKSS